MLVNPALEIIQVQHLSDTELVVDFSDGTTAVFTADQLACCAQELWDTDGTHQEPELIQHGCA